MAEVATESRMVAEAPLRRPRIAPPSPPRAAPAAACGDAVPSSSPLIPSLTQAQWRGTSSAPLLLPVIFSICLTMMSPLPACCSCPPFLLSLTLRPPRLPQHHFTCHHPTPSSSASRVLSAFPPKDSLSPEVDTPLAPLVPSEIPSMSSPYSSSPLSSLLSSLLSVE